MNGYYGRQGKYAEASGNITTPVLASMFSALENRSDVVLEKPSNDVAAYQLTVRSMGDSLALIINRSTVDNLSNWWLNFQYDAFKKVPDNFVYPVLTDTNTFYSVTFSVPNGDRFEVSVCPVYPEAPSGSNKDIIRVCVSPPAFPEEYEAQLHSDYFAQDVCNVFHCKNKYKEFEVSPGVNAPLSLDKRRLELARTNVSGSVLDIEVPEFWDFAFESSLGRENSSGDKTIPQILGRLSFLRDCVQEPAKFHVVQFTKLSYVGVLQNVCGFNVFFQVNASLPMTSLVSFFPGTAIRYPHSLRAARRLNPYNLLLRRASPNVLRAEAQEHANVLKLVEKRRKRAVRDANNNETPELRRQINLLKSVCNVADSRVLMYTRVFEQVQLSKMMQSIMNVVKLFAVNIGDTARGAMTAIAKRNLIDDVMKIKFELLRHCLLRMQADEVLQFDRILRSSVDRYVIALLICFSPALTNG